MSYGYNVEALAYAIKKAREAYDPRDWSNPEGCDMVRAALTLLATDLAIGLHPDKRTAFLARCGALED